MATTLPIPIEFQLPEGWHGAAPDAVGATGAAFVALCSTADAGFTPNITISGAVMDREQSLTGIADNSLAELRADFDDVELVTREEIGSEAAPALTQLIRLIAEFSDGRRALSQSQVYLAMRDTQDSSKSVSLHLTLTCTSDQLDAVIGDFQEFIRTVRPEAPATE